jgi:hypothetical protein
LWVSFLCLAYVFILLNNVFNPIVNAICNGTAGVIGPAQKAQIAPKTVHHQGLTNTARKPVTRHGDQNIASATTKYTKVSLFITSRRKKRHTFFMRRLIFIRFTPTISFFFV